VSASALYEGSVRHRRHDAPPRALRHRLALAYLDLDELPTLLGGRLLRARPGYLRFRRRDYHGDPARPLAEAVRDTVAARTGTRPAGPVRMLAQLRTAGLCFNPIALYYCFADPAAERLHSVLAEVTNTPWRERHAYVLAPPAHQAPGAVLRGELPKALHVSPFQGIDHHRYVWRLTAPAETLSLHIESRRHDDPVFDATLALRRRALTRAALARTSARHPLATLRVLALIYAHGAALALAGARRHPHPQPPPRAQAPT
jgi:hypothetical protein